MVDMFCHFSAFVYAVRTVLCVWTAQSHISDYMLIFTANKQRQVFEVQQIAVMYLATQCGNIQVNSAFTLPSKNYPRTTARRYRKAPNICHWVLKWLN